MAVMYHLMGDSAKCRKMLEHAADIKPADIDLIGVGKLLDEKMF